MNVKILLILTWIFYLANQKTADDLWFFCMLYSCVLAVCAIFYRMENHAKAPQKRKTPK